MEQMWEKKWNSFKKNKPKTIHNNDNILRSLDEELLNELTQDQKNKVAHVAKEMPVDHLSFDNIFQGKKRIVVPFATGPTDELKELEDFLKSNGYQAEFEDGLVSKEIDTRQGKQVRKTKIGKFLSKYISMKNKRLELMRNFRGLEDDYRSQLRDKSQELRHNEEYSKKFYANQEAGRIPTSISLTQWAREDAENLLVNEKKKWKDAERAFEIFQEKIRKEYRNSRARAEEISRLLKFWNEKSDFYRKNPKSILGDSETYSLVITRAPIDVLRMSDFEKITSCHSPPGRSSGAGNGYYKCAIAEANGHGPIVYVVRNEDIPEDFDWQQEEVFGDEKRNIDGPIPISRVRVRKFTSPSGDNRAIPEKSTYGKEFPSLVPSVTQFFRKAQPDFEEPTDDEAHHLDNWQRWGGTYNDSDDDELFDNFFNTNKFYGDAEQKDDGSEVDLIDLWETQCAEIDQEFNNFDHAQAEYEIEDNGAGDAYVLMNGKMEIIIPERFTLEGRENYPNYATQQAISNLILEEVNHIVDNVTFDLYERPGFTFILSAIEPYDHTPEGYKYFLADTVDDLDRAHDEIATKILKILGEHNLLKDTHLSVTRDKISNKDFSFTHFDAKVDENNEIEIFSKNDSYININVDLFKPKGKLENELSLSAVISNHEGFMWFEPFGDQQFNVNFWESVMEFLEAKANRSGEEYVKPFAPKFGLEPAPDLGRVVHRKNSNSPWINKRYFNFIITHADSEEEVKITLDMLKIIDENFDKIEEIANKVYTKMAKEYIKNNSSELEEVFRIENLVEQILKDIEPSLNNNKKLIISVGGQ